MKIKNWLWPIVSMVCLALVIIGICLNTWDLTETVGELSGVVASFGIFSDYSNFKNGVLGTLALVAIIIAFLALAFAVLLSIFKMVGAKLPFKKLSLLASIVLLVASICFITFELVLMFSNSTEVLGVTSKLVGQFGLWSLMCGLIFGTISSFMTTAELGGKRAKKSRKK